MGKGANTRGKKWLWRSELGKSVTKTMELK